MTQTNTTKADITTIIAKQGSAPIEIARVARTIPGVEILAQEYLDALAALHRAQSELSLVNEILRDDMTQALSLINPVSEDDIETMTTLASEYAASAPAGRAVIRDGLVEVKTRMIDSVGPDNRGIVESMFASAITTGVAIIATERCSATVRDIKAELMAFAI